MISYAAAKKKQEKHSMHYVLLVAKRWQYPEAITVRGEIALCVLFCWVFFLRRNDENLHNSQL